MTALRYSNDDVAAVTELVALHLRFHTYSMGWSDSAVRRYVRDAGDLLAELNVLTRCDCTTRNEKKAVRLVEADGRTRGAHRRARGGRGTGGAAARTRRQRRDGSTSGSGRDATWATRCSSCWTLRLDEGLLGDDEIRQRLDAWWTARTGTG